MAIMECGCVEAKPEGVKSRKLKKNKNNQVVNAAAKNMYMCIRGLRVNHTNVFFVFSTHALRLVV